MDCTLTAAMKAALPILLALPLMACDDAMLADTGCTQLELGVGIRGADCGSLSVSELAQMKSEADS